MSAAEPTATAIGFTMDDGVPIRFNGVDRVTVPPW